MGKTRKWYGKGNYKESYIRSNKKIKLLVDEWTPTYGLPIINKKFKNYELMKKWYGDDFRKRAFLKIPISFESKVKEINDKSMKIIQRYKVKGEYLNNVKEGGEYEDWIRCKFMLAYSKKSKEFINLITSEIYRNKKKLDSPSLLDIEKILYKSSGAKVIIKPYKVWYNEKNCGVTWVIDKLVVLKSDSGSESEEDLEI